MIEIDGVLISEDIVEKHFVCRLSACKGACCWEGDFGAPVTTSEMRGIAENLNKIQAFIPEESVQTIEKHGAFAFYDEVGKWGTQLHPDGRCVFLKTNESGIASCGIEMAYSDGRSKINKPISCHLYPIRVVRDPKAGFEAWNYDAWDICSPACSYGRDQGVKIYQFLKSAIVRYKGEAFYTQLDEAAKYMENSK